MKAGFRLLARTKEKQSLTLFRSLVILCLIPLSRPSKLGIKTGFLYLLCSEIHYNTLFLQRGGIL